MAQLGKLGFDEFVILWRHLRNWSEIFKKFDTENNMAINSGQLKAAFREVGINVNRVVLRLLVNRYGHRPKEANRIEDEIYFNDFICCALKIKRCIEIWNSKKIRSSPSGPTGFGDFGSLIPGALGAMGAPRGFGNAFSTFAGAFGGNHPMFNRQRPRPSNESSFTLDEVTDSIITCLKTILIEIFLFVSVHSRSAIFLNRNFLKLCLIFCGHKKAFVEIVTFQLAHYLSISLFNHSIIILKRIIIF